VKSPSAKLDSGLGRSGMTAVVAEAGGWEFGLIGMATVALDGTS